MLQAACYVVCAYLTGMRDCEVQAMRAGCLSLSRSADGVIERHRIRSIAYKGKASQGEPAEWVTIEPVAEAIRVLRAALGARCRRPRLRHALAGACPQDGNKGACLCRDRPSAQRLSRPSRRAVRAPRTRHHSASIQRRALAHHDTTVPPHHRLAHRQPALRHDRRHDPVQACLGRCVRRLCRFQQIGFPRGGRDERGLGQIDDLLTYFDERHAGDSLPVPPVLESPRSWMRPADARSFAGHDCRSRPAAHVARKPRPHAPCRCARRLLLRSRNRALPEADHRVRSDVAVDRPLRADTLS